MDKVPSEIIRSIFAELDDKSKRSCRGVSTQWLNLVNYSHFILYFTRPSSVPQIMSRLSKYSYPIGIEFRKSIGVRYSDILDSLALIPNLTSLNIPDDIENDIEDIEELLKWRSLSSLREIIPDILPAKCFSSTNLRKFSLLISDSSDEDARLLFKKNSNIEDLEFVFLPKEKTKSDHFKSLANPSRLTRLVLTSTAEIAGLRTLNNLKELVYRDKDLDEYSSEDENADLDPVPEALPFNKLTSLEKIIIHAQDFKDINLNTNLTYLEVQSNSLERKMDSFCGSLARLTKLRVLNIGYQIEAKNILQLSVLTNLNELNLEIFDSDEGNGFLSFNAPITTLNLRYDSSFDLQNLLHFSSLQQLELIEHEVNEQNQNENFSVLGSLPNLTKLSVISHTPIDRDLVVSGLTALKELQLDAFNFEPNDFLSLKNMERISFSLPINSELFNNLAIMTNLTSLDAALTRNEPYNYDAVFKNLPLKKLNLFDTEQEDLLKAIVNLSTLECLMISNVGSDEGFLELTRLSNLTTLCLVKLTHDCKHLSALSNLRRLSVELEDFHSGQLEEAIAHMPRLFSFSKNYLQ